MTGQPARAGASAPVRVVLLARGAATLPEHAPWDPGSARWSWSAFGGEPVPGDGRGYAVAPVRADAAAAGRSPVRPALALVRTAARSVRARADLGWVRGLRGSRELRRAVREADVLWSLDPQTDAALDAVPELTTGRSVLTARDWADAEPVLSALDALLAEVAEGPGDEEEPPGEEQLERWRAAAAALEVDRLPGALLAEDAVVGAVAAHRARHGLLAAARAAVALDAAGWPAGPRGRSGLAALRAAADLTLGTLTWEAVNEAALAGQAEETVRGADEALAAGDPRRALARLGEAMSLLYHRARHAEVPRSALVDDPAAYLAPLRGSAALAELLRPWASRPDPDAGGAGAGAPEPGPTPEPEPDRDRRVLVVTGAYGSFHDGVVDALRGAAEVKIRDFTRPHPSLAVKILDPWVLPTLAVLAAPGKGAPAWADEALRAEVTEVRRTLGPMLRWADVVLADWADRATVWVSHLCPPEARLVVRVHALDALDPWFPLVRWDRVEQVVVVSEPMRSLVVDLLAALDVDLPVHVVRHAVTPLPDLARPKEESARTTLGMIGWNRRVKDVAWALDLLERDPSWELVLVGTPPADNPGPVALPYVEQVRARIASPALRDRVHAVGQVQDVGEPLRRIGVILSASLRESWHLGLVEGAASGAVPVVRDWPLLARRGGPRTLFPDEWVVDDLDAAEARVRRTTDPAAWPEESARAREQALALFDPASVAEDYRQLLLHGRPPGGAGARG